MVKGNLWLKTHCKKKNQTYCRKKKVGRLVQQCSHGFVVTTQRRSTAGQETPFSWFSCLHAPTPSHSSLQSLKYKTTVSLPCSKTLPPLPTASGWNSKRTSARWPFMTLLLLTFISHASGCCLPVCYIWLSELSLEIGSLFFLLSFSPRTRVAR